MLDKATPVALAFRNVDTPTSGAQTRPRVWRGLTSEKQARRRRGLDAATLHWLHCFDLAWRATLSGLLLPAVAVLTNGLADGRTPMTMPLADFSEHLPCLFAPVRHATPIVGTPWLALHAASARQSNHQLLSMLPCRTPWRLSPCRGSSFTLPVPPAVSQTLFVRSVLPCGEAFPGTIGE